MTIGALPTPRVTFHNRGFRRGAGDTLLPEETMSDNDFVARLRIRWETMGDMANDERAAAADEIEFLRRSQRELMAKVAALTAERDEARRMYCEEAFCHRFDERRFNERCVPSPISNARQIAHNMKWDCFKENTND